MTLNLLHWFQKKTKQFSEMSKKGEKTGFICNIKSNTGTFLKHPVVMYQPYGTLTFEKTSPGFGTTNDGTYS